MKQNPSFFEGLSISSHRFSSTVPIQSPCKSWLFQNYLFIERAYGCLLPPIVLTFFQFFSIIQVSFIRDAKTALFGLCFLWNASFGNRRQRLGISFCKNSKSFLPLSKFLKDPIWEKIWRIFILFKLEVTLSGENHNSLYAHWVFCKRWAAPVWARTNTWTIFSSPHESVN